MAIRTTSERSSCVALLSEGGSQHGASNFRSLASSLEEEQDEAELRYLRGKRDGKRKQQALTMDRAKINFVLYMKKDKNVKSVLRNWWLIKRIINMDEKRMKNSLLSLAVVGHVMSKYSKRGIQLQSGLARVMAMVVLPFVIPPMIVIGIPTLVLLLPLLILISAIISLNRSAKKILLQRRRVKASAPRQGLSSRMSLVVENVANSFYNSPNNYNKSSKAASSTAIARKASAFSSNPSSSVLSSSEETTSSCTTTATTITTSSAGSISIPPTSTGGPPPRFIKEKSLRSTSWSFRSRKSWVKPEKASRRRSSYVQ